MPDIDIDLFDRQKLLNLVDHIPASMKKENNLVKHQVGIYFQQIPQTEEGISSIEYEQAEKLGWQKIDLLTNHVYEGIKNEQHLVELLTTPIDWNVLQNKNLVEKLVHIGKYYDLLQKLKPQSIDQLAMFLALLRPGKKHLQNKSWEKIKKEIWAPTDDYFFKKSHAYAYALAIVVQINKILKQNEI